MLTIHRAESRGVAHHGWLQSYHTFSFADYYNPDRMGFGVLRVINDDTVVPGAGFGAHSHRDMEIVSIPLLGALQHRDSEGNATVIRKGEIQIMSAGTGITHSEFNASATEEVKFLQIWVKPKELGIKPRYEQKFFSPEGRTDKFQLVVASLGEENSVSIHQDAYFSLAQLSAGKELSYDLKRRGQGIYLLVLEGEIQCLAKTLKSRDAIAITDLDAITIKSQTLSEILVIEVCL